MRPGGLLKLLAVGIPGFAAVLAVIMVVAGLMQSPKAGADLAAFEKDPGCLAGRQAGSGGLCRVADVPVITVTPSVGSSKGETEAHLSVRMPDGQTQVVYLDGTPGEAFAEAVFPGDPAKITLFRGEVVAVAARNLVAETTASPILRAKSARLLPIFGAFLLATAALGLWLGRRFSARVQG